MSFGGIHPQAVMGREAVTDLPRTRATGSQHFSSTRAPPLQLPGLCQHQDTGENTPGAQSAQDKPQSPGL